MKTLKFYLFALLALPVLTTSCDKDDDEEDDVVAACKTTKSYFYDPQTGTVQDSVLYTYTGDQVTKLDIPGYGFITLEYTNNRITKRSMYDNTTPTTPDSYEVITYNTDGTLQKIDHFSGIPATKWRTTTVTYSGGKWNKVTVTEDNGSGTFQPVEEYVYTYTGNNITTVVASDLTVTPADTYTYTYAYDNNVNYFTKQNPQFMFADPFFGEFDGTLVPLLVSTNNNTTISVSGIPFAQFTYQLDAKGNLSRVNFNGNALVGYNYQCP